MESAVRRARVCCREDDGEGISGCFNRSGDRRVEHYQDMTGMDAYDGHVLVTVAIKITRINGCTLRDKVFGAGIAIIRMCAGVSISNGCRNGLQRLISQSGGYII